MNVVRSTDLKVAKVPFGASLWILGKLSFQVLLHQRNCGCCESNGIEAVLHATRRVDVLSIELYRRVATLTLVCLRRELVPLCTT